MDAKRRPKSMALQLKDDGPGRANRRLPKLEIRTPSPGFHAPTCSRKFVGAINLALSSGNGFSIAAKTLKQSPAMVNRFQLSNRRAGPSALALPWVGPRLSSPLPPPPTTSASGRVGARPKAGFSPPSQTIQSIHQILKAPTGLLSPTKSRIAEIREFFFANWVLCNAPDLQFPSRSNRRSGLLFGCNKPSEAAGLLDPQRQRFYPPCMPSSLIVISILVPPGQHERPWLPSAITAVRPHPGFSFIWLMDANRANFPLFPPIFPGTGNGKTRRGWRATRMLPGPSFTICS